MILNGSVWVTVRCRSHVVVHSFDCSCMKNHLILCTLLYLPGDQIINGDLLNSYYQNQLYLQIGTSMVLGTLLSAPIMFVSSKMISVMKSVNHKIDETFSNALFDIGILSSVCCVSILFNWYQYSSY